MMPLKNSLEEIQRYHRKQYYYINFYNTILPSQPSSRSRLSEEVQQWRRKDACLVSTSKIPYCNSHQFSISLGQMITSHHPRGRTLLEAVRGNTMVRCCRYTCISSGLLAGWDHLRRERTVMARIILTSMVILEEKWVLSTFIHAMFIILSSTAFTSIVSSGCSSSS